MTVILQLVCTVQVDALQIRAFFVKDPPPPLQCNPSSVPTISALLPWLRSVAATTKKPQERLPLRRSKKDDLRLAYLSNSEIDDNKLSTTDTSDTEGDSGTWFWNESANESDSGSEEEGNNIDEGDLEEEHSKTERAASPEEEGESNLRGGYRSGSRSSQKRQKKSAKELEKEGSKLYNIRALWQDLGILSATNSQGGLGQPSGLLPNVHIPYLMFFGGVHPFCPSNKSLKTNGLRH